jgi:hypothetical protein
MRWHIPGMDSRVGPRAIVFIDRRRPVFVGRCSVLWRGGSPSWRTIGSPSLIGWHDFAIPESPGFGCRCDGWLALIGRRLQFRIRACGLHVLGLRCDWWYMSRVRRSFVLGPWPGCDSAVAAVIAHSVDGRVVIDNGVGRSRIFSAREGRNERRLRGRTPQARQCFLRSRLPPEWG